MDTNYLEEAFKRLSLLEDDFDITADAGKVDELKSFVEDDVEEIPEEEIVDVNADDESELQDNYIGKVILECECCHSRIYKEEADVIIDEESGLANVAEQCPVCNNELGYTVIGKIEPFNKDREIKPEEPEEEVEELPADDVAEEEVEEVIESLENRIARKHLVESDEDVCPECGKNPCECDKVDEGCKEVEESCDKELDEDLGGAPAEDPKDLGLDPDRAVEDDVKLETPQENPIREGKELNELFGFGGGPKAKGVLYQIVKSNNGYQVWAYTESDDKETRNKLNALAKYLQEDENDFKYKVQYYGGDSKGTLKEIQRITKDKDPFHNAYNIDTAGKSDRWYREFINWAKENGYSSLVEESLGEDFADVLSADEFESVISGGLGRNKGNRDDSFISDDIGDVIGRQLERLGLDFDDFSDYTEMYKALDERGKRIVSNRLRKHIDFRDIDESLTEGIENLSLETDAQHIEVHSTEDGGVSLTAEPISEGELPADDLSITDEPLDAEAGEEEIVPLDAEEEAAIEANEPEGEEVEETEEEVVEEEPAEGEEAEGEEGEEEVDVEDFEEENFDEMGESYMRKVYGNVKNYKTTKINEDKNSIIIEGLITFESGKQKTTKFVFEHASFSKRGKLVLEGYNTTFTKANKAFMLRGSLVDKKYIPESLIYNYKVRQLNESTGSDETIRVYGRIKKK